MDNAYFLYVIIIGSLLFSAFFSGLEIAFISSNKLMTELESDQGNRRASIISFFQKWPSWFIGAMLLGNNVALVIYGIYTAQALDPWLLQISSNGFFLLLIKTLISTLVVLTFAEFLPKAIFRKNPNRYLNLASLPLIVMAPVLVLPTWITLIISNGILRLFKINISHDKPAFGTIDLDHYVSEMKERAGNHKQLDHEIQIFQNALHFPKVKARDCMIPRTDIIAVDVETSIDDLRKIFINTGLSKVLVYRDSIDNIIGYVHSYELFKRPANIKMILRPVSIVPETIVANKVMKLLIRQSRSIAVVVDEFGGTSGMITIEDVIEEIFGEILDEHDTSELFEEKVSDEEYNFSGRLEIDYLNEKYDLTLPESDDYDTLAGYIIHKLESIPDPDEKIDLDGYHFVITEVSGKKIEQVCLKLNQET